MQWSQVFGAPGQERHMAVFRHRKETGGRRQNALPLNQTRDFVQSPGVRSTLNFYFKSPE
jgi:hypothetical protein